MGSVLTTIEEEEKKMQGGETKQEFLDEIYKMDDINTDENMKRVKDIGTAIARLYPVDVETGKATVITDLPWEGIEDKDTAAQVKTEVFGLSQNLDRLSQLTSEIRYHFSYYKSTYEFVSTVMVNLDQNLYKTYEQLVPMTVSDDEFWTNYFYSIEEIKMKHGVHNILGTKIDEMKRQATIEVQVKQIEDKGVSDEQAIIEDDTEDKSADNTAEVTIEQSKVADETGDAIELQQV